MSESTLSASDLWSLPRSMMAYSSGVTMGSFQDLGLITERNACWKKGPVSQIYIQGLGLCLHIFLPLCRKHSQVFGRIFRRFIPSRSNSHPSHSTGQGAGFFPLRFLFALPSAVSNVAALSSGRVLNNWLKS